MAPSTTTAVTPALVSARHCMGGRGKQKERGGGGRQKSSGLPRMARRRHRPSPPASHRAGRRSGHRLRFGREKGEVKNELGFQVEAGRRRFCFTGIAGGPSDLIRRQIALGGWRAAFSPGAAARWADSAARSSVFGL